MNQVTPRPMGLGLSLLYFGIPALAMALGFYVLMPLLARRGLTPYMAYMAGLGLPLLVMLIAALVAYRLEGHPWEWRALMARFGYRRMTGRDWLWTAGVFALESFVVLVINVVGEEFWWRGYVLPRQVLAFGALTWLIHGLLWTGFHAYKWWNLIGLLPLSLGLTWVVLHRENNTLGLIIHFITNGSGVIPILLGVLSKSN